MHSLLSPANLQIRKVPVFLLVHCFHFYSYLFSPERYSCRMRCIEECQKSRIFSPIRNYCVTFRSYCFISIQHYSQFFQHAQISSKNPTAATRLRNTFARNYSIINKCTGGLSLILSHFITGLFARSFLCKGN